MGQTSRVGTESSRLERGGDMLGSLKLQEETSQTGKPVREKIRLSTNALKVLEARYLKKDHRGKIVETPEELFQRVAKTVVSAERQHKTLSEEQMQDLEIRFYNLMVTGEFMPNSPTLMNAGREMGMLSACFVLPIEDSIDGIFNSIKNTAIIQKAGGGTGFDFGSLRPNGDIVRSSGGTTSGPLSFLKVFSKATDAIQQGAFRRGANMGMMSIHHPDIIDFIRIKEDLTELTNYNLSVKLTDEFMDTLKTDPNKVLETINPRNGERGKLAKRGQKDQYWTVKEVFDLIVDRAWQTGEPGVAFIDKINEVNPTPHIGRMEATNPCGEQPLLPYEACNLGSINVGKFVVQEGGKPRYDYAALKRVTHMATRFLDDVIDANNYQLPQIDAMCKGNRKIGVGVMGFADALYGLGISYNSDEGVQFGESIMQLINDESHVASEALAKEKGCFPNWEGSRWDTKFKRLMRNACTTTVAPSGTISIIANCSGGIEPLFSLAFFRNVLNGQRLVEVNDYFVKVAKDGGFYSDALIEKLGKEGSLDHVEGIPDEIRRVFVTAHQIQPDWHVKMQAAFQRHCDSSISKTINFSNDAKKEEVEKIYRMAYDYNLKGVTVYRDGCRLSQPMALDNAKDKAKTAGAAPASAPAGFLEQRPIELPEIMPGVRIRQRTPFGNMHVKISVEPKLGIEREVFAQLGKGGDIANSDLEAICRMLSLFLRCNGSIKLAVKQLEGIGSSLSVPSKDGRVMSLADGLAKAIHNYLKAKEKFGLVRVLSGDIDFAELRTPAVAGSPEAPRGKGNGNAAFAVKCPECEASLAFEEGCVKCYGCGFSQC